MRPAQATGTGKQTGGGRRGYRSPRRQQQAAETRAAVLAAASELFCARGWSGTSVREVAASAGVAVETVYTAARSKTDLLLAALEAAVVGDDGPRALADRPAFAAIGIGALADRASAAARLATEIHQRSAGLWATLREAARAEPEAAARMEDLEERRRADVAEALSLVAGRPLDDRERDGLWAIGVPEVYRLLVEHGGWSAEQYEAWLTDVVVRLLESPPEKARP